MTALEEIRSEIEELNEYRQFLCMLEKEASLSKETQNNTKDKPKVKRLEIRRGEHV